MTNLLIETSIVATLIYTMVDDILHYRIKNVTIIVLLVLSLAFLLLNYELIRIIVNVLLAVVCFFLLFLTYQRNLIGGGDAKMLTVALLWVGPSYALLFSVSLFASTVLYWIGAQWDIIPYKIVGGRMVIPFGPSVACAWIATILATHAL